LVVDPAGNFYGTTHTGGNGIFGSVFKLTPGGVESVLYAFQDGADGWDPTSYLSIDSSGTLYGTTALGGSSGANCPAGPDGCGTVFKVAPDGTETVLYSFQGGSDGWQPDGGVILDGSGNLYGVTSGGGGAPGCEAGCGAVYKLAPDGTETVLYAFQGGSDGLEPIGDLLIDRKGNLFGVTGSGGTCSILSVGCGTVFKVAPGGAETVLNAFRGGNDGYIPYAGLVEDKDGNLYGTTLRGGSQHCNHYGCGTAFKVTPGGKETVLYAFSASHGKFPAAALLTGEHDTLYGTAAEGGKHNDGLVFSLTTK
jgi:uncharacterized repeat protein (TIGR03803 family)